MTERLKPGPVPRYPEEKRLSVSLDPAMADRIRALADRRRTTQAEVIRRLLRKALR